MQFNWIATSTVMQPETKMREVSPTKLVARCYERAPRLCLFQTFNLYIFTIETLLVPCNKHGVKDRQLSTYQHFV